MPSIRILPDELVNLIAAGEVVERPASVAKELVENSIDAGASSIEIEAEQGGRRSITVRDDGCGMSRHDLLLSVQRHATSKLGSVGDLERISSLGFRGEALPSIAAVCHLGMVTGDGVEAWKLDMDGGILRDVSPAARTRGTTVSASGLFFNQPARRRFLRSEDTELSWLSKYVTALSFARPETAFSLKHNSLAVFALPPEDLEERVGRRFGIAPGSGLISTSAEEGGYSVRIAVCPDKRFASRAHCYALVNGRFVNTRLLLGPVERAFAGPAGYPVAVCVMNCPGSDVDVNVHPAKLEVRFRDPARVESLLLEALSRQDSERREALRGRIFMPLREIPPIEARQAAFDLSAPLQAPEAPAQDALRVIQIGRSYIVTSVAGGVVIVDQHAAHERILFELITRSLAETGVAPSQRLLLPETVEIDSGMNSILAQYESILTSAGFEFSSEDGQITLTAAPEGVRHALESFLEVLGSLADPSRASLPPLHQIAAAAACAGSIKFGDSVTPQAARELIDALFSTSEPFRCPHGRPTLIEISFEELASRFGR
jgi:DNA mismatch repair protein MutL